MEQGRWICIGAIGIVSVVMLVLWTRKRKDDVRKTVLFFPSSDGESYRILSTTIKNARRSLDVCVFTICNRELVNILINAHLNGTIVRVITDYEQENIDGAQCWKLRQSGIQVRTNSSSYLMHHKFCIVDDSELINGSLNWTAQGVECNEENVVITNDVSLVKQFSGHFNKLWNTYDTTNVNDVQTEYHNN